MKYSKNIKIISEKFNLIYNTPCETIQEAEILSKKIEKLMYALQSLIMKIVDDNKMPAYEKNIVCSETLVLLANQIGCSLDEEKYGTFIENLFNENKITKLDVDIFYNNLNTGRWK